MNRLMEGKLQRMREVAVEFTPPNYLPSVSLFAGRYKSYLSRTNTMLRSRGVTITT
jgi:hypothetical protein